MDIGKWSQPGVPHKGWSCDHVVDLGIYERAICEMCEKQEIRFVHSMSHRLLTLKFSNVAACALGTWRMT